LGKQQIKTYQELFDYIENQPLLRRIENAEGDSFKLIRVEKGGGNQPVILEDTNGNPKKDHYGNTRLAIIYLNGPAYHNPSNILITDSHKKDLIEILKIPRSFF